MDSQSFDEPTEIQTFIEPVGLENPMPPRGYTFLAWCVIIATIGLIVAPNILFEDKSASEPSNIIFEIQARYIVGAESFLSMDKARKEEEVQTLFGKGPLRQRLMGVVLLGELVSLEKAEKSLGEIEVQIKTEQLHASEADLELIHDLHQVHSAISEKTTLDEAVPEESLAIKNRVTEKLGWVGKLALLPPGSSDHIGREELLDHARRTLFVILGVFSAAVLAMTCGAFLQFLWWVFAATGRLNSGIIPIRGNGGIYAETFAVWLALFLAISFLLRILPLPKLGLVWILVPQIGGLGALAWPVMRGIGWNDLRNDIGLSFGKSPWTTPLVGIGTYLSALPVVGAAMIVTLLMMLVANHFSQPGDAAPTPMHPIVEPILRGSWAIRLQLVFIAVFAAIPEEIMFRGVLYRHLREAGKGFGYFGCVIFAIFISSFVFAVIHPQGLFGIPILMGLASVFALAREWRGSLVPSIIAHAMVNAGTSTILLLIAD